MVALFPSSPAEDLLAEGPCAMTGKELHQLLLDRWGYSYGLQLRRTQGKIFLQIMWKYLEQASFPMDEGEYFSHLDEVASYLVALGAAEAIAQTIRETREKPRLGKAVSIPIELGARASEWFPD